VPPHPGPIAALERLGADPGRTLFYSLILALPLSIISGPFYARYICRRVDVEPGPMAEQFTNVALPARTPALGLTLVTMLMPVLLMLLASAAMVDGTPRRVIGFIGSPLVAMMVATILAFITFGRSCRFSRVRLLEFAEQSLPPIAGVLLVVGAGGGFGRVLVTAHVDTAIAQAMGGLQLSPLVMGWVIASLLRLSVGSATVSVITAASIMAPLVSGIPGVNKELLVVSIGAGSLIASHVNDGGFWLVKEYLNMSVPQTLASWTVIETIVSVLGLAGVLLLGLVV
jgi:GntP family gluconate:H+ symporter